MRRTHSGSGTLEHDLIELSGKDHASQPLLTRHAVVHSEGQMLLTGLGVAMVLERLKQIGGTVVMLELP